MMLEDQTWPKRCGHMAGKEVVAAWAIDHMNMGPEFFSQTWMSRTLSSPPPTGVVHSFEHPEGPVVTVEYENF